MTNYVSQFNLIKKTLGITNIVSVRFANKKSSLYQQYKDAVCTALARALKTKEYVFIDRKHGQACPGGNYFLNVKKYSKKEICDVYVKEEKVFNDDKICLSFLKKIPPYPRQAKRYILFSPLEKEVKKPEVVILLLNPAAAARLLGLAAFKKMNYPNIIPGAPTCLSVYAPLVAHQIHLNFIDYYDRYYQGKQKGKLIWNDGEMIISLPFLIFIDILKAIPLSGQGLHKPTLKPQATSRI